MRALNSLLATIRECIFSQGHSRDSTSKDRGTRSNHVIRLIIWSAVVSGGLNPHAALALDDTLARPALLNPKALTDAVFLDVTLVGPRTIAVGERGLVFADNGDGNFRQMQVPTGVTLTRVYFSSPTDGWAVGHRGVVLHTIDAGKTWIKEFDGIEAARRTLAYFQAEKTAGRGNPSIVQKQIDAARQLVEDGADKPFLDVYFETPSTGYVLGAYDVIFKTFDGGKSWMPWEAHLDNPDGLHLYAIGRSGGDLYIVGERGLILRSTNDGENFARCASPYEGSFFGLISAPNEVVVYGLRGHAYSSADQGRTWKKIEGLPDSSLFAGALIDGRMYLSNQSGQLFVRTASDMPFKMVPTSSPAQYTGIAEGGKGTLVLSSTHGIWSVRPETGFATPAIGVSP